MHKVSKVLGWKGLENQVWLKNSVPLWFNGVV